MESVGVGVGERRWEIRFGILCGFQLEDSGGRMLGVWGAYEEGVEVGSGLQLAVGAGVMVSG